MREFDPGGYVNQIEYIFFYFLFVCLPYGVTKIARGHYRNGTGVFCDLIGITRVETYNIYIYISHYHPIAIEYYSTGVGELVVHDSRVCMRV